MNIIGISGAAGSGKDTLAEMIKEDGWERFAYADALKKICIEYLGLSYNDVYTQEGKMKFNDFWGMTNREILQKVGTDAFRNGFHRDTWIKIAELKLKEMLRAGKKIIVTDVRFDNEAKLIESLGGCVLRIERNLTSDLSNKEQAHASEKGIDENLISFVVLNIMSKKDLRIEFNVKLNEFENKYNEIKKSLMKEDEFKKDVEEFIWKCKKFLKVEPSFFVRTNSKNIRFEWVGYNYDGVLTLVTNFKNNTMTISYSKNGKVLENSEVLIDKYSFDFVNEKIESISGK